MNIDYKVLGDAGSRPNSGIRRSGVSSCVTAPSPP